MNSTVESFITAWERRYPLAAQFGDKIVVTECVLRDGTKGYEARVEAPTGRLSFPWRMSAETMQAWTERRPIPFKVESGSLA
jgi:hypothetical protein